MNHTTWTCITDTVYVKQLTRYKNDGGQVNPCTDTINCMVEVSWGGKNGNLSCTEHWMKVTVINLYNLFNGTDRREVEGLLTLGIILLWKFLSCFFQDVIL